VKIVRACTIAAKNYLAQVRVLAASFKRHHPAGEFTTLVIDDLLAPREDFSQDPDNVVLLGDIGLPLDEIRRMAMIYDVTEFSTSVKPWLLRHLLQTGSEPVIYLDPDIEIFAPMDDIFEMAREHSIVLTPHGMQPFPNDGLRLNESDILGSGIYNLGFLGLGAGSGDFLDWWSRRLSRECVIDPAHMRFTDQRWIDFVPALFRHHILKDEGCNVAYWNLHGRKVEWTGAGYEVNGEPLRFFHYSGYDPDVPHLLSRHMGDRPRILLSQEPGVARLCAEYSRKLGEAGFSNRKKTGYFYDRLENGFRLSAPVRRLYRDALIAAESYPEKEMPPVPFLPGGTALFMDWLNEPAEHGGAHLTRFLKGLHACRPDLQRAFPDPANRNAADYIDWILNTGRKECDIPEELIPAERTGKFSDANKCASGPVARVDVAGYFQAELGIGEAARLLLTGLQAAGISYHTQSVRNTISRQQHPFPERAGEDQPGAKIKILCVNGDATPAVASELGASFFEGNYTIGVWFWEIEQFPESMFRGFDFVDEIWVASEFIARALRKVSPKPVYAFPLPAPVLKPSTQVSRKDLGIPEGFLFYYSFDFLSVFERKNPIGLVQAFTTAFKNGEGPVLVIKSINGHSHLPNLEKLRHAASGRRDIVIMDGYLPHDRKNAMMALCDCYVSLHRGEGFGLTMAEAMSLAKPVIATQYGGNLDFMTESNSFLCPYKLRPVGSGSEPYPPKAEWADPDISKAASLMRYVHAHPSEAAGQGKIAAVDIQSKQSSTACARFIHERLAAIGETVIVPKGPARLPRSRPPGEMDSKAQVVMDQLETTIKDLALLEDELESVARRLAN
jgi:glycosyltransferase involved in cell wall biosynthesis